MRFFSVLIIMDFLWGLFSLNIFLPIKLFARKLLLVLTSSICGLLWLIFFLFSISCPDSAEEMSGEVWHCPRDVGWPPCLCFGEEWTGKEETDEDFHHLRFFVIVNEEELEGMPSGQGLIWESAQPFLLLGSEKGLRLGLRQSQNRSPRLEPSQRFSDKPRR